MANTLSLCSLLDSNKLIRLNFDSWYRKLKIILEYERILYMLTDPTPEEPTANAHGIIKDTYQKWLNDHTTIRCIMRAVINDKFSCKFKDAQPKQMIQILNEFFDTPENAKRHKTSYAVFNALAKNSQKTEKLKFHGAVQLADPVQSESNQFH
ncbi:uncharacterized protein [Elaeis guineensis]|uniref:uncharacterized protein n=1 Tax=Elaeis guineensis var. tenera TaxID=51953 RepID=UPI003C6DA6B2